MRAPQTRARATGRSASRSRLRTTPPRRHRSAREPGAAAARGRAARRGHSTSARRSRPARRVGRERDRVGAAVDRAALGRVGQVLPRRRRAAPLRRRAARADRARRRRVISSCSPSRRWRSGARRRPRRRAQITSVAYGDSERECGRDEVRDQPAGARARGSAAGARAATPWLSMWLLCSRSGG